MSSERPNQTVIDYVTIVFSPALIMGLVASLVFFLLEVFYKANGEYKARLQWILFFFVFGEVLAARVSLMGEIAGRSGLYGGILAFLTWFGMGSFVEYPPDGGLKELSWLINLLLIGVVWWCAYRLVWDCTNIDEETDINAEGLLQVAGLEEPASGKIDSDTETDLTVEAEVEKKKSRPIGLVAWWERWQKYRAEQEKKRVLGIWVVYFSLAALPLFGLGQSLIPVSDGQRRQFTFWLMTVYVGSGLGLLVTTCFLSLRRYLRQRRLQMPAAMTATWMATGGGLILVLLLVGALLPRPHAEYSLFGVVNPVGSAKRNASHIAGMDGGSGTGEGRPGERQPGGEQPANSQQGTGAGDQGWGGKGQAKATQGNSGQGNQNSQEKGTQEKQNDSGSQKNSAETEKSTQKGNEERGQGNSQGTSSMQRTQSSITLIVQSLAPVLKWIIFALLAIVAVGFVCRAVVGFLAGFTDWARRLLQAWNRFWETLIGRQKKQGEDEAVPGGADEDEAWHQPFASFVNPFDSGAAENWTARELVRYTFAAVQAWTRERDLAREADETALEFAERLVGEVPALEVELGQLVGLYARAVYAPGRMPANTAEVVRKFWKKLKRVVEAPLSA